MSEPRYPSLYQINTRVWLTEWSRTLGRPATLDDIPDAELDRLAKLGFDWIWFLSVWCTGELGKKISRDNSEWRSDFENTLPDLQEQDIAGSGFAITDYHVDPDLGGDYRNPAIDQHPPLDWEVGGQELRHVVGVILDVEGGSVSPQRLPGEKRHSPCGPVRRDHPDRSADHHHKRQNRDQPAGPGHEAGPLELVEGTESERRGADASAAPEPALAAQQIAQ
jgi:hypothetical protein